jgi:hypothetical protein
MKNAINEAGRQETIGNSILPFFAHHVDRSGSLLI